MKLYPHQEAGVEWLMRTPRGGLFDDQGLGKTAQVITAAERLALPRVLVVAPSAVLLNWRTEWRQWAPQRVAQVVETGRDVLRSDAGLVVVSHSMLLAPSVRRQLVGFDLVVLDEAHAMRNPTAARTQAFFLGADAVCRQAPRCWLLTGTPMPNNPAEVWAPLAGVAPERLRDEKGLLSYAAFRNRYCVVRQTTYGEQVVGSRNDAELRKRLRGFYLRRTKNDALSLPPIRFATVAVPLAGELQDREDIMRAALGGADDDDVLARVRASMSFAEWRHECARAKVPGVVELLATELHGGMRKVVVFAHHRDVLDALADGLHEFEPLMIDGSVSAAQRAALVEQFQRGSARVMIAQLQAAGVGITLTAAHNVVFVEQSFVPGDNMQAADRCYRIGQQHPVLVRLVTLAQASGAESLDEIVTGILARKMAMIRSVVEKS